VVFGAAGIDNKAMLSFDRQYAEAASAQPLTESLLEDAGIKPGMRVLVVGRGVCDLALLVAERVGCHGCVVAAHADAHVVGQARRRAAEEGFDRVSFRTKALDAIAVEGLFDAVIGRFYLAHKSDPVESLRLVARTVHEGGRIAFQEWHYESMLWADTSAWPRLPLYRDFARWTIEGLRRGGVHVDMGLRLANCFSAAGLRVPVLSTDLRTVHGADSLGYGFFAAMQRELFPTPAECGVAAVGVDVETFADRLERETIASGGHVFLPLQVAAWTRAKPPISPGK
jgi:SAM-dependent methyltransferase